MQRRQAFTLIELLVVISIISLLLSIMLPALTNARNAARAVVCQSNQRQIAVMTHMYTQEWDGYVPATRQSSGKIWDKPLRAMNPSANKAFLCPGQTFVKYSGPNDVRSYAFNATMTELKWANIYGVTNPDQVILMIDTANSEIGAYNYSVLKNGTIAAEWNKQYRKILTVHAGKSNAFFVDLHVAPVPGTTAWLTDAGRWTPTGNLRYVNAP